MAASTWQLLTVGVFCGLGVLTAASYLLTSQKGGNRRGIWALESAEAFGKRMRRRRLGAALLAATCIGMFLGLVTIEPAGAGVGYVVYWLIILIMLAWLVVLALMDLLQTKRLGRGHAGESHDTNAGDDRRRS